MSIGKTLLAAFIAVAQIAVVFVAPAIAHEVAAVVAQPADKVLLGDEQSDAMTTATMSPAPGKSCGMETKKLRLPYQEEGRPDETP